MNGFCSEEHEVFFFLLLLLLQKLSFCVVFCIVFCVLFCTVFCIVLYCVLYCVFHLPNRSFYKLNMFILNTPITNFVMNYASKNKNNFQNDFCRVCVTL